MPQIIDIPLVGQVEFPDTMSDDDIGAAAKKLHTDHIIGLHTKNLQTGQTLEGSKQAITPEGRLTGTLTPPPTVTGELGKGLIGVGKGALHAVQGVGQMAQGITDPMSIITGEMQRQQEISKKPQTLGTDLERIPLIGAAGAGIVEDWKKATQGTTEDFGEVLGRQGLPLLLGTGAQAKGVKAGKIARYDPQGAVEDMAQMLRKTGAATNEQLGELAPKLQEAIPEIHHQALRDNITFDNLDTAKAVDLTTKAKNNLWKENVTRHMNTLGKVRSDMSSIPEAMKKGLDPQIAEHGAIINEIDDMAAKDFAKPWSMQRIENRIQSLNAETKSVDFAQKVGQAKAGAKLRMLDALRDLEADRIGAITGEDTKAFKSRYGALAETEKYLEKAHNINEGTKLSTPKQGKLGTAYKNLKAIDIAHPGGIPEQLVKMVVNKDLTPDQLIGRSMKKMGGRSQRVAPGAYKGNAPLALPPAPTSQAGQTYNIMSPRGGPTGNINPAYPARAALPPIGGTGGPPGDIIPTSGQKITPSAIPGSPSYPVTRTPTQQPAGSNLISQGAISDIPYRPVTPEEFTGPYATAGAPITPEMSMDQYLTLQKLSPEARQFLGYGRKQIPPPPTGKP